MESEKRAALVKWLKLTRVPKLGPKRIKDLFEIYPDIDSVFCSSDEQLLRTRIFNEEMLKEWNKVKAASDENFIKAIDQCIEKDISILTFIDEGYPSRLRRIPYPPLTLFLKGDLSLLHSRIIAIVGTREASEEAKKWTFENAKSLAQKGITVVSGGAIGIDTAAHLGALEIPHGKTICVLGSGFFRLYPEENTGLFNKITEKGLLISEHLPNFPGSRISFIQRNRITSGLSSAIIMVASKVTGGAMVQTKIAFEQRKPIFCPKISLQLQPNEGLKQVIQEWEGKEIDNAEEILKLDIFEEDEKRPAGRQEKLIAGG